MNLYVNDQNKNNNNIINIIKGISFSIICTVICLFIFSIILTYTNLSEKLITPVIIILTAISILIGSSIATSKIKKNGILNGGFIGGIYIAILYIFSSIINLNFTITKESLIIILVSIFCGILGGIIGVNKKVSKK